MTTKTAPVYTAPDDRHGEVIIIVVHRYDDPRDTWGVHELTDVDSTKQFPSGSRIRTVGLFERKPIIGPAFNPIRRTLAAEIAVVPTNSLGAVLTAGVYVKALFDHIGREIIPIEWKARWAAGDKSILDRVEVWA